MKRRDVQLSPWSVDLERDPIREPPRPLSLRHADYEDHFDFTTVFYDCFWNAAGTAIILLGPPLLNLQQDLNLAIVAYPSMRSCDITPRHVFLGCQIVAKAPAGTTGLIITTGTSESFIAPQPNLCELFRDRRTAITLSRNNELAWIRDWATFNKDYHDCDAVLIYDNGSDRYGINDIYDCLGPRADGMQIVVLSWPFKYGVPDWRLPVSYGMLESLYCQAGMLEHARHRCLAHARSVLNTDVDELVLTERRTGIFELVERSATGLLAFGGVWVENHPIGRRRNAGCPARHKDFGWVRTGDRIGCENKWAVVPTRVPHAAQWHVHRILGMAPSECRQAVEIRHFKAINTNWTVDRNRAQDRRTDTGAIEPGCLRLDVALREALARVFPDESREDAAPDSSHPRRSAYAWRVQAGRLASEQRWSDAIGAAATAASLMPDHPGFRLFLAHLQEHENRKEEGRALRAQAEALRRRDPWYHLQCGRWLHDEGDPVAAHASFARAIELDPKFAIAYHEMARNEYHCGYRGRPIRADEILQACARHVPDDALTRALLAKELERKGRLHDALAQIETATALAPENPHYHALHGKVLRRIGRLDEAERAARRGIALDDLPVRMQAFGAQSALEGWREYQWRAPTAPEVHAELAEILMAKGDWARAETAARSALACVRTDPERHHRLGEILAMRGGHEEAPAELESAIELAREDLRRPTPHDWPLTSRNRSLAARATRLSRLLRAAGRAKGAIAVLREALVTVPDSSAIKEDLAMLLADGDDRKAAAALLRSAIVRRPKEARLRHSLSKVVLASDLPQAIAAAATAAELVPDHPTFQDHLVKLLLAAERTDEAAVALANALPLNPKDAGLYFRLSQVLQRRQRPTEALAAARRAVALDPGKPHLHAHLAALALEAGEDAEAETILRDALARHPGVADLHFQQSRLLQRRHRAGEAVAAARRAVALEPHRARWRDRVAELLVDARRLAEAEAELRDALARKVESGGLYFRLSRLLQHERRTDEALAAARCAVALEPQKSYLRAHLVALLLQLDKDQEAEAALDEALERHPGDAALHFHQSRLLQRRGRPEEAVAAAQRAVGHEPQRPRWRDHLAVLLVAAGRLGEAEAELRQALVRNVESGGIYFGLSRLLHGHRPEEALALAWRAVALEPEKSYLREYLVTLLVELGKDGEADAALRDALERHPSDPALHFHQSRLLQRRHRTADAVAAARRAVALDPKRARWRDHLSALLAKTGGPGEAGHVAHGTPRPSLLQFPAARSGPHQGGPSTRIRPARIPGPAPDSRATAPAAVKTR